MKSIIEIIYLILPVMLGAISNMVFVKFPCCGVLNVPMDKGKVLSDGKRLLGDNKTWKGFFGMITLTSFWFVVVSIFTRNFIWVQKIALLPYSTYNTPFTELMYGAIWGLGYVLAELPNSFIKRRLNISPGKNAKGFLGKLFIFVDQSDSVVGCLLFMLFFYIPTIIDILLIFVIATILHYIINILLFLIKLKKQAG